MRSIGTLHRYILPSVRWTPTNHLSEGISHKASWSSMVSIDPTVNIFQKLLPLLDRDAPSCTGLH
jgi:hypothetical protein